MKLSACIREVEDKSDNRLYYLGPLVEMDDGRISMGNIIKRGKVNGFEGSYALAILGTIVLNVAHVLHA